MKCITREHAKVDRIACLNILLIPMPNSFLLLHTK